MQRELCKRQSTMRVELPREKGTETRTEKKFFEKVTWVLTEKIVDKIGVPKRCAFFCQASSILSAFLVLIPPLAASTS